MNSNITFKKRIIQATSWVIVGHVSGQLLRLASNLIMTRLLVPEMFGIMAIANVLLIGLSMLSDMGIRQHIIQSKHSESEIFLNTAWVVQIIRGGIIWLITLLTSLFFVMYASDIPWASGSVYADPILPLVIAALSFTAIFNGLESTKLSMANRNLVVNLVVRNELISQIVGLITMVAWVYIDRSIWGLVIGGLVSSFMRMALSHVALPGYKNKFYWDRESFFELFHFGKWIFLTSALGFLVLNGDKLILAGLISAKLLGIYTLAIFITGSIRQLFNKLANSVALSAFSDVVRRRPEDLNKVYYKFRLPADGIILVTAGILFISGTHLIDFLYDERYREAGKMLEILSLLLIFERYSLVAQCFIALGKPKYLVPLSTARLPVLYILLPIVYGNYGLEAALWVIALNRLSELPILLFLKIKTSLLNLRKEIYLLSFFFIGLFLGWVVNLVLG
ncbi:MAG: oligosaccharide flippase family protein [Candidatus Marithrix sp.]